MADVVDFGEQRLGTTQRYVLTLLDDGNAVVDLSGVTGYDATLAPGSGLGAIATITAATRVAASGTVTVTIDDGDIEGRMAGDYEVFVTATDSAGEPLNASRTAVITLTDGPGTALPLSSGWTRAKAERSIVRRLKPALGAADLPKSGVGGNPSLAEPLLAALDHLGISPADPSEPSDADFAGVSASQSRALIDIALYETMLSIGMGFIQVGWAYGSIRQDLGQFRADMLKQAKSRGDFCLARYGYGRTRNGGPAFGARPDVAPAAIASTVPFPPVAYGPYGYPYSGC